MAAPSSCKLLCKAALMGYVGVWPEAGPSAIQQVQQCGLLYQAGIAAAIALVLDRVGWIVIRLACVAGFWLPRVGFRRKGAAIWCQTYVYACI